MPATRRIRAATTGPAQLVGFQKDAIEFYTDIKGRMAGFDRAPGDCAICTSMTVVLGETEAIAREKAEYLTSLVPLEMVLATNSAMLGADLKPDPRRG